MDTTWKLHDRMQAFVVYTCVKLIRNFTHFFQSHFCNFWKDRLKLCFSLSNDKQIGINSTMLVYINYTNVRKVSKVLKPKLEYFLGPNYWITFLTFKNLFYCSTYGRNCQSKFKHLKIIFFIILQKFLLFKF